jgi:hypothetical protein
MISLHALENKIIHSSRNFAGRVQYTIDWIRDSARNMLSRNKKDLWTFSQLLEDIEKVTWIHVYSDWEIKLSFDIKSRENFDKLMGILSNISHRELSYWGIKWNPWKLRIHFVLSDEVKKSFTPEIRTGHSFDLPRVGIAFVIHKTREWKTDSDIWDTTHIIWRVQSTYENESIPEKWHVQVSQQFLLNTETGSIDTFYDEKVTVFIPKTVVQKTK